ncbi:MAG: DNA polymerase III subunit beta [Ignavibacteria bacterium]|nr:DNA polymerase III subunit beta [Ignavibacteria bacterium]
MKFSTTGGGLLKVLSKAFSVVPSKSPLPILDHFLFEVSGTTLTVTATNLEITMVVTTSVKGNTNGKIAVPASIILNTVQALPQNTSVNFAANIASKKIALTTEKGTYHLTGQNAEDFPQVSEFKSSEKVTFEPETLRKIITRTTFAASTDDLRPAMTGVLFEFLGTELRTVATDGHRLVRIKNKNIANEGKRDLIVPQKALQILVRSLDENSCTITHDENQAKFSFDATTLYTRLVNEKYPNYEAVIPTDNDKNVRINREDFLQAVRRIGLYTNSETKQLRLSIKKKEIIVAAEDIGLSGGNQSANEELACENSNEEIEIGFNAGYIADALSHLENEEIILSLSTSTRAAMFKPAQNTENEDVLMLVMPVRLNS